MDFQLQTETPSQAIVRLSLAKPENIEKFGGRFWHGQRGDGMMAFLGQIVDSSNIRFAGETFNNGEFNGTSIEVRISPEDCDALLESVEDIQTRIAEVKVIITGEAAMKTLTVNGEPKNSIVIWGSVAGVRQGSSNLESDKFDSREQVLKFLEGNRETARKSRAEYRAGLAMANAVKNDAEVSNNALA